MRNFVGSSFLGWFGGHRSRPLGLEMPVVELEPDPQPTFYLVPADIKVVPTTGGTYTYVDVMIDPDETFSAALYDGVHFTLTLLQATNKIRITPITTNETGIDREDIMSVTAQGKTLYLNLVQHSL